MKMRCQDAKRKRPATTTATLLTRTTAVSSLKESVNHVPVKLMRSGTVVNSDADGDGICDDVDDCFGTYDECGVCNGPGAIFECGCTDIPESDCDCDGNQLDALGVCGGDCEADDDADGICNDDEIPGCQDESACNLDIFATDSDFCIYPEGICETCSGENDGTGTVVNNDSDGDGVCDEDEVPGCQEETACNYNSNATDSDNSCVFPEGICESCSGETDGSGTVVNNDADGDGICDDVDDCFGTYDECGVCNGPGAIFECGCTDIPESDCDCDGNQLDALGVCGGDCEADDDADGICNDDEIPGCQDESACNFDISQPTQISASIQKASAKPARAKMMERELSSTTTVTVTECVMKMRCQGCQEETACNYNSNATDSDNSCVFPEGICESCSGETDGSEPSSTMTPMEMESVTT